MSWHTNIKFTQDDKTSFVYTYLVVLPIIEYAINVTSQVIANNYFTGSLNTLFLAYFILDLPNFYQCNFTRITQLPHKNLKDS